MRSGEMDGYDASVEIDMRSGEKDGYDAIFLSPHKFLRGPGSPGIPSNEQFSLSAQVFSFINLWRWEFDIHWCQFSYSSYVLHAFSYGMTLVFIGANFQEGRVCLTFYDVIYAKPILKTNFFVAIYDYSNNILIGTLNNYYLMSTQ